MTYIINIISKNLNEFFLRLYSYVNKNILQGKIIYKILFNQIWFDVYTNKYLIIYCYKYLLIVYGISQTLSLQLRFDKDFPFPDSAMDRQFQYQTYWGLPSVRFRLSWPSVHYLTKSDIIFTWRKGLMKISSS